MEWVDLLRAALDGEFGDRPRVVTLATVTKRRRPRARSMVCRRIDDDGRIYFVSDARSGKNRQLQWNLLAEAVCWLPIRREQFRVSGMIAVSRSPDDDPLRREMWGGLSGATRATFCWPTPGTPRTDDAAAFPRQVEREGDVPPTFEVLVLIPDEVEFLDLNPHPHDRRRWAAFGGWRPQGLNP